MYYSGDKHNIASRRIPEKPGFIPALTYDVKKANQGYLMSLNLENRNQAYNNQLLLFPPNLFLAFIANSRKIQYFYL